MSADSTVLQTLLGKVQKAGKAGCKRSVLIGKSKVLEKQAALQELEKEGRVVHKANGALVFFFAAEHSPMPPHEALSALVTGSQEKGALLWKESDLVKALTKAKYYSLAEATAAAKALCNSAQMLEVKDGKTRKYIHCSAFPVPGPIHHWDEYFISETARLIYALVELDGESRQRALGLTQEHYRNADLARQWRNKISMLIHPDVCRHPKAQDAVTELTMMYQEMTA